MWVQRRSDLREKTMKAGKLFVKARCVHTVIGTQKLRAWVTDMY